MDPGHESSSLVNQVEVGRRFRRSVNLDRDAGSPDALDGYVVTPAIRRALSQITGGLDDAAGDRAWSLHRGQMLRSFNLSIPTAAGPVEHALKIGDTLFVVGANGSGKSSLISLLFKAHHQSAKRISAHRQTWFTSNTLDLTPHGREQLAENIRARDQHAASRWREDYAEQRAGAAIYDLIDADNMLARAIADLVRMGNIAEAQNRVKSPAPIAVVNELLRLSNIPIAISVEKRQKIVATRPGALPYSVAELSDGERNAFLIAADVLTAEPGTLLLIDEPERHLHRAITAPLLSLLFEHRKDCAFIISTHDVTHQRSSLWPAPRLPCPAARSRSGRCATHS